MVTIKDQSKQEEAQAYVLIYQAAFIDGYRYAKNSRAKDNTIWKQISKAAHRSWLKRVHKHNKLKGGKKKQSGK